MPSTIATHLGREGILALRAVDDAVGLARSVRGPASALTKPDASPVTAVDFAVQALIGARLARDFPDDAVLGEEDASGLREESGAGIADQVTRIVRRVIPAAQPGQVLDWIDLGGRPPGTRFWALDPIDGTRGLLAGRQYAIALALVSGGAVQVGAIGCPRLSLPDRGYGDGLGASAAGGVAVAVRGGGAWWAEAGTERFVRLTVSGLRDLSVARVLRSYEPQHGDMARLDRVLAPWGGNVRRVLMDSQVKHVVLAAGTADLLVRFASQPDFHDAIWDCAAGSLLIEEAGGRVTDVAGRTLDFTAGRRLLRNDGLLASNGALHDEALASIRATAAVRT
jgi:3'(2'), 5'-bisphosphate nucleotidase